MSENRISRSLVLACGLLPVILVAGCGTAPPLITGRINPQPVTQMGQVDLTQQTDAIYALHPNDIISIAVFREPDLSSPSVPIAADGAIAVPLLGRLVAAGKTTTQLAEEIRRGLTPGYVLNPSVSVNVLQYGSHSVAVDGAVKQPGVFDFKPGARLSSAISLAGGVSRVARLSQVAIFRTDQTGMLVARFDYRAVSQGTMIDPLLMPNDRVVVGTSGLSQAYQDFLQTVPLMGVFVRFAS